MDERHDRLRQARIAAGFKTQAEAVRRFGWNPNTYKSNENGNAPFGFDQGREYARAYKVNPEWLYAASGPMKADDNLVPIIGRVGADTEGRVVRTLAQAANDMAPAPTGATSKSVALEVDGHSMRGFADDGALVYFENQHTPPTEDMLGEVVVLQIATGEHDADDEDVLVKRLLRGSREGLYDLESIVGPTLRDVQIRWAAEITQIIPPTIWLRAVFSFITRPTSNTPISRRTRTSPVTALTATSANWAPVECIEYLSISSGSGAFSSTSTASRPARDRIEA